MQVDKEALKEKYKALKIYIHVEGVLMECDLEIKNVIDVQQISSSHIVTDDRTVGRRNTVTATYTDTTHNVRSIGNKNGREDVEVDIISTTEQSDFIFADFKFVAITDNDSNLHTLVHTKSNERQNVINPPITKTTFTTT